MPVPPVSSDPRPAPVETADRPAGPARAALVRLAALVLVASLAGAACGQADETVSPDLRLSEVATDPLPQDRTAAVDPAAVRAETGAASPSDALGGVAAAPPTVAPPTAAPAAPVTAAPAASPAPTVAPATAPATVASTTIAPSPAPAAVGPASAATPAPSAPLPTLAVSGSGAPAPTPTTVATPVTAAETDLVAGEDRSFTLLNELRGGATLAPLTRDPALDTLAREWSRHMAETGELVHSDNPYGENIAFTSNASLTAAEAAAVFERLWSEDPGHSQNMMGAYVKVGVGVWKSDRGWYGTHLYNY